MQAPQLNGGKLFESTEAGWEKKPKGRQVLKTKVASGFPDPDRALWVSAKEDVMRSSRLVLLAMLMALPFAASAKAQVDVGVGVGPAVVDGPGAYDYARTTAMLTVPRYANGVITLITRMLAHLTAITGPVVLWRRVYWRRPLVPLGLGRHGWGGYGYRGGYGYGRGGYAYGGRGAMAVALPMQAADGWRRLRWPGTRV